MSGGTQQTTSTSKPMKEVKPLLTTAFNDALQFYNSGVGADTTSNVVPWSNQTSTAMTGITNMANRNANSPRGLNSNLQGIIDRGGFNQQQFGALGNMQRQLGQLGDNGLGSAQDKVQNRFQSQLRSLGANGLSNVQDDALQNYRRLANSNYNPNANPGAQGVLNAALRDQSNATNLDAAAAGRYGSGTHEGVLAQKAGDLSSSFRYSDFNNWLGRKDAANQNMASLSQQGIGNVQGLGQNIASLGQQGIQNRQGLSSSLFNAAQTGLGNMSQAYQGMKQPFTDLMGVGSMNEDLYRRTLDDQDRLQNQPWTQLQKLLAAAGGAGNYSTNVTTAPGPNPFLQTLGGVTSGVGLLGSLGIF